MIPVGQTFQSVSRVGQVVDLPSLSRCRTFDLPPTQRRRVKAGQRPARLGLVIDAIDHKITRSQESLVAFAEIA